MSISNGPLQASPDWLKPNYTNVTQNKQGLVSVHVRGLATGTTLRLEVEVKRMSLKRMQLKHSP